MLAPIRGFGYHGAMNADSLTPELQRREHE